MSGVPPSWWSRRRTPLLLALLAFVLYLPGFWWGAPEATGPELIHGWAVDDETPLGPLAQINNILHPQEVQNRAFRVGDPRGGRGAGGVGHRPGHVG